MSKKKVYISLGIVFLLVLFVSTGIFSIGNNQASKNSGNIAHKLMPVNVAYAETLDDIKGAMNKLRVEIETETKTNPQVAMQSHPGKFIRNSKNYQRILKLGLKAIKPLYDAIYDSRDSGCYEYILAMAIEDITGEKFVYNSDYGWKNSLEFRMAYDEKVNNTRFNVERISNNETLNDHDRTQKFKELGIFAVSDLIKEYRKSDSKVSKPSILEAVKGITSKYKELAITERTPTDSILAETQLFDSLVSLNGKAYK
ncbi:hypothetical protein [uncultured Gardnerella sp.]|uniref:hypothetical protein n=1 Tax=uncultured Gardnerella sp. TaxID=293424 RepID=UPI002636A064|nr:hypothetical protein [uncultured Gardnerella sp.]